MKAAFIGKHARNDRTSCVQVKTVVQARVDAYLRKGERVLTAEIQVGLRSNAAHAEVLGPAI